MAIAGGSNIEYRKDEKTRYVEADNITDITKEDLKTLKSTLDTETDLNTHLKNINDNVETVFNGFFSLEEGEKRNESVTLTVDNISVTKTPKEIIMSGSDAERNALGNYVIGLTGYDKSLNEIENAEIKAELKNYTFQLKDLRKTITAEDGTGEVDGNGNVLLNDLGEGAAKDKEATKYDSTQNYVDPYEVEGYATTTKDMDIADIYKDTKIRKYLEKMFDEDDQNNIRKGMFKINIGVEDGLAGIIVDIREAVAAGTADIPDETSDAWKLYDFLVNEKGVVLPVEEGGKLDITKDVLKEAIKKGLLTYDREGGWDSEQNKLYKILNRAEWGDLDTFAALLQSKTDETMAVKERYNNKEILTHNTIDKNNVLAFLCDINGDGIISAQYYKKDKKEKKHREAQKGSKEQQNQGDVGTLFGQQILFTIEQTINTKNVELGEPLGEQLVISNIIKNMEISDSRNLTGKQRELIDNFIADPKYCTKENLAKLMDGDEEESISPMPEFKILFLDAIKKINGGSKEINPDLADTLVGKEAENTLALYEKEANLKTKIDEILTASEDPKIQELIKQKGLVRVRETIMTKIVSFLDNIELTFNDGTKVPIGDKTQTGVTKGREIRETKNKLMKTITDNLYGGISLSLTGTISLSLGFGKSGISESGTRKRSRSVGSGVTVGTSGILLEIIGVSGAVDFQYNKNKVINSDLSKISSAKYVGAEGHAGLGVGFGEGETSMGIMASGGINRSRDPEIGLNQIDQQYRAVSEQIFDISGASASILADETAFTNHLKQNLETAKQDDTYGTFVTNNKHHLTDNLNFIVKYMAANKFFGDNGILKKYPAANSVNSINALLDIIQAGNIEQWRGDTIAARANKISLTKLGFGVTTSMLTFKTWKKKEPEIEKPVVVTAGGIYDKEPREVAGSVVVENLLNNDNGENVVPEAEVIDNTTPWNNTYTPVAADENVDQGENVSTTAGGGADKYGAFFMYVSARISTWKNSYAPNVPQYLFTQYETGQGIGAEAIDNSTKDLDKYGRYLLALYNDPKKRLSYTTQNKTLTLMFTPEKGSDLTLATFLNLHATQEAQAGFSLKGNTLVIGNVGDIGAYTITEAKGVQRILSLGSKKLDETTRVTENNATVTPTEITDKKPYNKEQTKDQINIIVDNMTGTGINLATAKTDAARFFDADGKLTIPAIYKDKVTFTPAGIQSNTVTSGELYITKKTDGTFLIAYSEDKNATDLKVTYKDQKEYDVAYAEAIKNPANLNPEVPTAVTNLFTYEGELLTTKTEMNTLIASLEELEDNNALEYSKFMSAISMALDGTIDAGEIADAIGHLEILMSKSKESTKFTVIKTALDKPNNDAVKSYIVDRFKQILARETYLKKMTVGGIAKSHYGRDKVKGPSKTGLDATLIKEMQTKKTTLQKTYAETPYAESPTVDPNLIGYTAFYRHNITNAYSITALGETGYQGELMTLENKDLASTRFLNNLKMNVFEVDRLAKSLETQFKAAGLTTVSLSKDTTTATRNLVNTLLTGGTITIDSGEKISIDLDWVFYLLGDCCNESLGMKIKNIKVQKLKDIVVVNGTYSGSGKPDIGYTGGANLFAKSHSIAADVTTKEVKIGVKGITKQMFKGKKNEFTADNDTGIY